MQKTRHLAALALVPSVFVFGAFRNAHGAPAPVKEPAKLTITTAPEPAAAGSESVVTLELTPVEGIKINKYPKVQFKVSELPGVVGAASASVGSAEPPPPDKIEGNYFKTVDPVELKVPISAKATSGKHEVPAQVIYYYCVAASGFCAPAKIPVTIPIVVR